MELLIQKNSGKQSNQSYLNSEEYQTDLDSLLTYSLQAGENEYATQIFYQLCGDGLQSNPPQIKLNDPKVFLLLAKKIADLKKQIPVISNNESKLELSNNDSKKRKKSDFSNDNTSSSNEENSNKKAKTSLSSFWNARLNNNNNNITSLDSDEELHVLFRK